MDAADSQQPVMEFLAKPASHGGRPVTRIDTHAAAVFLAGERALKIKRAVRFPFLDYSTLEKRKGACEAELAVNRPFAPAIYRRVVAITREADGSLALGGKGTPVEWAVEMSRFDENETLDHLVDGGRIDARLANALGRAVARAHDLVPVARDFGFADVLAEIIAQNTAELRAEPALFPAAQVEALDRATRDAFARVRALLAARERAGQVARCHGDLHLGNIVMIDNAPVLFDAIEFDPKIATSDVLYDLAFLLMDLIERGLKPAATIVLNRYLTDRGRDDDLDALAALPLFLSVRAAIRAKVTAARAKGRQLHCQGPRTPPSKARATISRWRKNCSRRRCRAASRSADYRAPASRCWRGCWRRTWPRRRARWCCAATSRASVCSAKKRPRSCRRRPIPRK